MSKPLIPKEKDTKPKPKPPHDRLTAALEERGRKGREIGRRLMMPLDELIREGGA